MEDNGYIKDLDKQFYKIRDVSELLGVPTSTLRYWESEFPEIMPKRSRSNQRYYRPDDIRILRMIHYLVKVKGLRIEAAKEELRSNRKNVSRRLEIIDLLTETKESLNEILGALNKRK
jgi:DNA-binding transcriptional MerR regulator